MKLPPPAKKTIDLEGRLIKDGVRKAIKDRQNALHELLNAINQYRKLSESKPLTLQGSDYAHAVLELNKAVEGFAVAVKRFPRRRGISRSTEMCENPRWIRPTRNDQHGRL
jgi:hypothetical protein